MIITDTRYVSAVLFHGYGLPPWYDLPEIQTKDCYRKIMTQDVNALIDRAAGAGYRSFEVQEAFPVDLMTLSDQARLIRNVDHFLPRGYHGAALLARDFPGLAPQPRRSLLTRLRLNGRAIDETDILALWLAARSIPLVYSDIRKSYLKNNRPWTGENLIIRNRLPEFPARLTISFTGEVPLGRADFYPGIERAGRTRLNARPSTPEQLLDFYRYAGILIQAAKKY